MLEPHAVDALLFDLDGTLMDSDDQAVERLTHRMGQWGLRNPRRAARRLVMALETPTNTLFTGLDVLGLDGLLSSLTGRLLGGRGLHRRADFRTVPGADQALRVLQGRYRLGVVTTRDRREAERFLEDSQWVEFFPVIVTRESTWRIKPHPAPILHAAALLNLPPERCAMVGDTTVDVRSARRAGAWAVAVLCGFGEQGELERAGAHLVLHSPAELPAALGLDTDTGP